MTDRRRTLKRSQVAEKAAETTDRRSPGAWRRLGVMPLSEDEREYVRATMKRAAFRPRAKECFQNSQRALLSDDEKRLTYWEGIAADIPHGWLTIGNDRIVDLTFGPAHVGLKLFVPKELRNDPRWRFGEGAVPDISDRMPDDYRGVPFDRSEVVDFVLRTNTFGSILIDEEVRKALGITVEMGGR